MRTLYLLRHAKSSWDDPALPDFDRPLAKRGRRACAAIAQHIEDEGISPETVLCSPSRRTRDTLAGILHALPADAQIQRPEELYNAGAGTILALVNGLADDLSSAMVICHNPGIQATAVELCGAGDELEAVRAKFPTAALATIEFAVDGWRKVVPGSGRLTALTLPRELEGA